MNQLPPRHHETASTRYPDHHATEFESVGPSAAASEFNSVGNVSGGPDSLESIAGDVEAFARDWIGRIRRLIHRSTQLIERESLLSGAIARLDQQRVDWNKRTKAKEQSISEQSKQLTEAWLEVEAERRKVAQGGRPVGQAGQVGQAGGVIPATAPGGQRSASPVRPTVVPQTIQTTASPPGHANSANSPQTGRPPSGTAEPITPRPSMQNTPVIPQDTPPPPTPGTPAGTGCGDAAPTAAGPIHPGAAGSGFPFSNAPSPPTSVPNTPIQPDSTSESNHHPDAVDTASRERIEEFKRMQRALRAHRR